MSQNTSASANDFKQRIPALCKQLLQLLDKDINDLEQLDATLDKEAEALRTRDSEQINQLAKLKASLVKQVEDRARAKVKLITASGAPIKAGQVKQGIDALGDQALSERWQLSLDRLADCQQKNQVNGLVIQRSKQRNETIMDMIRGKHQKPKLYGQKGSEQRYASSNRIAKA